MTIIMRMSQYVGSLATQNTTSRGVSLPDLRGPGHNGKRDSTTTEILLEMISLQILTSTYVQHESNNYRCFINY